MGHKTKIKFSFKFLLLFVYFFFLSGVLMEECETKYQ